MEWYDNAPISALSGEIDVPSNGVVFFLAGSGYTPDKAADAYLSDLADECAGTGYSSGGTALPSPTLNLDGDRFFLNADNVSGLNVTDVQYVVFAHPTGTAATSALLGWHDFGSEQTVTGLTFDPDGILGIPL